MSLPEPFASRDPLVIHPSDPIPQIDGPFTTEAAYRRSTAVLDRVEDTIALRLGYDTVDQWGKPFSHCPTCDYLRLERLWGGECARCRKDRSHDRDYMRTTGRL